MGRWRPKDIRPQAAQTHGVGADGVLRVEPGQQVIGRRRTGCGVGAEGFGRRSHRFSGSMDRGRWRLGLSLVRFGCSA